LLIIFFLLLGTVLIFYFWRPKVGVYECGRLCAGAAAYVRVQLLMLRVQLLMLPDKLVALLVCASLYQIDPHPDPPYLYLFSMFGYARTHTLSGCWSCVCICAVCLRNLRRCERVRDDDRWGMLMTRASRCEMMTGG